MTVHAKDDVDQVCDKYHEARTAWAQRSREKNGKRKKSSGYSRTYVKPHKGT